MTLIQKLNSFFKINFKKIDFKQSAFAKILDRNQFILYSSLILLCSITVLKIKKTVENKVTKISKIIGFRLRILVLDNFVLLKKLGILL